MISPIEIAPASAPGQVKVVRVSQKTRKQLVFCLTDDSARPVDLRAEVENPPAPLPDFSPQKAATDSHVTIRLGMFGAAGDLCGNIGPFEGQILDQEEHRGFVSFQLENRDTRIAGIWDLAIERSVPGGYATDRWPVLLIVEPPAMQMLSGSGPLLIPEIRLGLADVSSGTDGAPFSNLLDDVEFSDVEIVFAMRRVVQLWNETPPPIAIYSPANFPYRYWWLKATIGELMVMSAARYRRNRLAYSAGGVSIDDQSKAEEYETIGRAHLQEFQQWMRHTKRSINMGGCWRVGM